MKKQALFESQVRKFFMEKFYSNYGGKFGPYRKIMEEFSDKFSKICRLKRTWALSI